MSSPQQHTRTQMGEDDFRELVCGFVAGDRDKAERLVIYLNPILVGFLWNRFGSGPLAHQIEDIVQDAWLDAYQRRHRYDATRGRFDSWMCRIAWSRAIDRLRGVIRDLARVEYDPPAGDSDDLWGGGDEPPPRSTYDSLHEALLRLPQEDQKMLQFYSSYRGEDWQATYARITGMNRNTLRSRFARALRKLRDGMSGLGEEGDPR